MHILPQTLDNDQKMRKKISHLLILILRARLDAEKSNSQKTGQKMDFTGVKIAWVDIKFIEYPYFIYEIDQPKKLNTLSDFEN